MSTSTSVTKLNEHNYRTWAIEAKDLLKHLNVWRVVDGSKIVPRPPTPPEATESTTEAADTVDIKFKFKPESKDPAYLTRFDHFLRDWRAYCNNYEKATGTISGMLEPSVRSRYTEEKFDGPKVLWDRIKSDFEEIIKLDGEYEMAKLTTSKLESYPSVT
ncbi:hypothetical protein K440DRAFT_666543 [Wilcoxina mikolae CBS 423.85]|nr:hypothetical protein K440DRAFT_666543 [Wilcoxina mikolae CBS 423.85]